jgi:hypothetical protein
MRLGLGKYTYPLAPGDLELGKIKPVAASLSGGREGRSHRVDWP